MARGEGGWARLELTEPLVLLSDLSLYEQDVQRGFLGMNSVYTSLRGFILELFTLEADCKSLVDLGA